MRRRILESPVTENIPNFDEISSKYPYLHFSDFYWYFGDNLDIYFGETPMYIGDRINFDMGYSCFYYYSSWDDFENSRPSEKFYINGYMPDFPYIQGPPKSVSIEDTSVWSGGIIVFELYIDDIIELIHTSSRCTIIIPMMCSSRLSNTFLNSNSYNSEGPWTSMSMWNYNIGNSPVHAFFPLIYQNNIVDGDYFLCSFRSSSYGDDNNQWGVGIRFHFMA